MNNEALDILLARMKASASQPTAEQLRVLATVQLQVAQEVYDVLQIAADNIDGVDEDEEDTY